jgi:hypothetical protein
MLHRSRTKFEFYSDAISRIPVSTQAKRAQTVSGPVPTRSWLQPRLSGTDWYRDQWPGSRWEGDLCLMATQGPSIKLLLNRLHVEVTSFEAG